VALKWEGSVRCTARGDAYAPSLMRATSFNRLLGGLIQVKLVTIAVGVAQLSSYL